MTEERSQSPPSPASSGQGTTVNHQDRLSLPTPARCAYGLLGGFATGLFLGVSHGSQTSGLRFRAENAHRLPTTQKGWYLYHKSKNYNMMLGGLKDGLKLAPKLSLWAGSVFALEAAVDNIRGPREKDFLSTTVATLTVAGAWSLWSKSCRELRINLELSQAKPQADKLPLTTTARTAKLGLYTGLTFGLLQDLAGLARGRRLAYVDFLMRKNPDSVEHTG